MYISRVELSLSGTFEGIVCKDAVQNVIVHMVDNITHSLQTALHHGHICSTMKDVILLPDEGSLSIRPSGVS